MARHHRRYLCRKCKQRKALFCSEGRWKADRQHDLCTRCYQSVRDRVLSAQIKPTIYDISSASSPRRLEIGGHQTGADSSVNPI